MQAKHIYTKEKSGRAMDFKVSTKFFLGSVSTHPPIIYHPIHPSIHPILDGACLLSAMLGGALSFHPHGC